MADIQGTNNDDLIRGGRGDDVVDGLDGDDRITDVGGNNTIDAGAGDDRVLASRGEDVIDGGSGSDQIWARDGDDIVTYRLSENFGAQDYYDGGQGADTLRLVLTAEEAQDTAVLATIAELRSFVEGSDPGSSSQPPATFTFSINGLDASVTLRNFEGLEVFVDEPLPSLSIDDPTVAEGDPSGPDATITFTVTRSGDVSAASTVAYTVLPGSAVTPADYNGSLDALSGTLTFDIGETEKTITLDVTDDLIPESTESFTIELSAPTNADIVKGVGTGTITDPDVLAPTLSIDDPTVAEGDPSGPDATITFTVTRSGDISAASTVDYTVQPGSATTPEDYNDSIDALSGTLSFAIGETTQAITLDVTDDLIPESTESFTVELSAPTNADIVKGVGTGTITDVDALAPTLSINDPTVAEGDPSGPDATITFTVTRSGDVSAASTVAYTVQPGSAVTPADYNDSLDALSGTLTFDIGETEKTITLDVTDDLIPELSESFTIELSAPTNADIVKGVGTGTITDPDVLAPSLSIDDPTVAEGDPSGPDATITFTVTRSGDVSAASTVAYTILPGSATTPEDYNDSIDALSGTLSFAIGETDKTITLDVTDDLIPESTETFTVELSAPTNADIVKGVGTGTITDPDALAPSLSIDDPTVAEGDPGGPDATITFTVTRSGDVSAASTVAYAVVPGTAGTPGDYSAIDALAGTLTFAAGETVQTIELDITDDLIPESTESFTVELSAPTNADIAKGVGTGTITDADALVPSLSIDDPTVAEGDPGGPDATITFTVTRSGDVSAASTVAYTVLPGSATTPADYNDSIDALSGTLSFAIGETEKMITLERHR